MGPVSPLPGSAPLAVQSEYGRGEKDCWRIAERENGKFIVMQKNILHIAVVTGCILLVPLVAMQFTDEVKWGPLDFVFMGSFIFGTGLTYELIARKGGTLAYRVAVGIACATGLFLVWVNAAVGIIGDEDLANTMYLGVLVVGFVGAFIARFEAHGMSRALVATAVAQALVPLVALTWVPATDFAPGVAPVMGLNAVFVAMWIASALLFRRAAGGCRENREVEVNPTNV